MVGNSVGSKPGGASQDEKFGRRFDLPLMYFSQRSSFLSFSLLEGVLLTGMNDLVVETPQY